ARVRRDAVRIVSADEGRLLARMLRARLSERPGFDVVGIAGNGREAVSLAEDLAPDLLVMDVSMPVLDGIQATRLIRTAPDPPVVLFVTGEDAASNARAYEVGAAAYLNKSTALLALMDMIVAVSALTLA